MFAGGGIRLPSGHILVPVFHAVDLVVGPQQPVEGGRGQGRPCGVAQGTGEQRHTATGARQRHVGQPYVFPEALSE